MANALLNSNIITNRALAILHQKCNFIGSINRQYDDSFAQDGAKIGTTLRIRLPNRYTVRSGPVLVAQDTVENSVTLTVASQKGVDVNFTSQELTMNIDDFQRRILDPAMAVLAANIEADALTMMTQVWNTVDGTGSVQSFRNIVQGRKILLDNLTPAGDWNVRLNTQDNVDLVDSLKGLFQASTNIASQYRDGVMGMTGGFEFAENTNINTFTRGAAVNYTTSTATGQNGAQLAVITGTGAMVVGDVFTIAGVYRVHPETRTNTGVLQQFVVTAPYAGGPGTISISPALYPTGALQNVSNSPAASSAITFLLGAANKTSGVSLAYQKDAFTFATADLVMPDGVDMKSRAVQDGLSMRLLRQYDINNDRFPCRLDILYGYQAIRPQLAVRLAAN